MTAPELDSRTRLLTAEPGPVPWRGEPGLLIGELEASGLTGRGGGGFPVWRKLAAARAAHGTPVVVANGAEGEPGSAKDRTLLTAVPHLVLDGLALAAEAVAADHAFVLAPAAVAPLVRAALAGRSDRVPVEVVVAAGGFLDGEESAVVARLEGRPALPRDRFRRVVESGVRGRPTVVQNVETLAHLATIARHGASWFRSTGTATEPGTALVTLGGAIASPGVHEVAQGAPLAEVLALGGTRPEAPVLVGGFHGAWLTPAEVDTAAFSRESLRPCGASPGAGVLVVLDPARSGLAETAHIVGWLAGQGAGQCGPCRNGLPRMAGTLRDLAAGHPVDAEVHRLAALVESRGACHHPDGTVRLVRSALRVFATT